VTLEKFLLSRARWRLIQGPWGSGKTTACIFALAELALSQPPGRDGKRRRRTYVVRNTYDDLLRTTIASWRTIFTEDRFGPVKLSKPYRHEIRIGDLEWEVVFLALDDADDRKKLLSAEFSDIWFNEFREMLRELMDDSDGRIGRYPSAMDGGCLRPTVVGDTNAPAPDHWFSYMSGQTPIPLDKTDDERRALVKPDSWDVFLQPGALIEVKDAAGKVTGYRPNPAAENVVGHTKRDEAGNVIQPGHDYWMNMTAGKTASWVRVNILNKPGHLQAGEPVHPQFADHQHVAKRRIEPVPGHPILYGMDFGRTPALVAGQLVHGRWRIFYERVVPKGHSMGAKQFAKFAQLDLAMRFPGFVVKGWGDPTGENMEQSDDISPFLMVRSEGMTIYPAPTNDPAVRIGAVNEALTDLMDGEPRILFCPEGCPNLIAALDGGYQYPKNFRDAPLKNQHSHVADALQYLLIGAGEGRALLHARPASGGGNVVSIGAGRTARGNAFSRRGLGGFRRG
jgi:hypothetical protein